MKVQVVKAAAPCVDLARVACQMRTERHLKTFIRYYVRITSKSELYNGAWN